MHQIISASSSRTDFPAVKRSTLCISVTVKQELDQ